jgi:dolichol kinase
MLLVLLPMTAVAVFIDYGRFYFSWLNKFFLWAVGPILRPHERDTSKKLISGGSFVLISACLCIFVFPKLIAITAFSILIISDASSALIGRRFGRRHFLDKSLEGTLAFIVTAWCVVAVSPKVLGVWQEYLIGCIAAVIGSFIEAASVSLRADDNFSVPLSIGFVMWFEYYLFSLIDPSVFESVLHHLN